MTTNKVMTLAFDDGCRTEVFNIPYDANIHLLLRCANGKYAGSSNTPTEISDIIYHIGHLVADESTEFYDDEELMVSRDEIGSWRKYLVREPKAFESVGVFRLGIID